MTEPTTDEIWTTRDGRQIPVGEMEVDHLRAALRMVLRAQRGKENKLRKLRISNERLRAHVKDLVHSLQSPAPKSNDDMALMINPAAIKLMEADIDADNQWGRD